MVVKSLGRLPSFLCQDSELQASFARSLRVSSWAGSVCLNPSWRGLWALKIRRLVTQRQLRVGWPWGLPTVKPGKERS